MLYSTLYFLCFSAWSIRVFGIDGERDAQLNLFYQDKHILQEFKIETQIGPVARY